MNSDMRAPMALPAAYHTTSDTMCLQLKTTVDIPNNGGETDPNGIVTRAIALTPGIINTTNYSSLGNYFPVLVGLRSSYARFMISRLKVTVLCTSPYTGGGFIAANFESDNTGVSGPPTSLGDVTNALHSCVSTPGAPRTYTCVVADYFNDWRSATTSSTAGAAEEIDAGVIQLYGTNNSAKGVGVALLTIEVDFYFSGYRSTS